MRLRLKTRKSKRKLPRLLPGEKVIEVTEYSESRPILYPSSTEAIYKLARAQSKGEVGVRGPVLAAEPIRGHDSISEFNRYKAIYARDAERVAMDLVTSYPELAKNTIIYLCVKQGLIKNDKREEEYGRILHEDRDPEKDTVANQLTKDRGWGWPYYGAVDTTPEHLRLVSRYCRLVKSGPEILNQSFVDKAGSTRSITSAVEMDLEWMIGRLNASKDGLLEYHRMLPGGLENQMWRDSWDSFFHHDGKLANLDKGIASLDVQRVTYEALLDSAEIYEQYLGRKKEADELKEKARLLEKKILEKFWCEDDGGYFVIGLDRGDDNSLRQLQIKTSDMGHLLHSRLLIAPERENQREAVIRQLFSKEMLGINGIMSLASNEYRFREGAYHNGSVWGWDNYLIAQGLEDQGYFALADFIEQRLLEVIRRTHRYVELSRGGNDPSPRISSRVVKVWDGTYKRENTIEQPPQDMQAWTVAAVLAIKEKRKQRGYSREATDPKKRELEKELLSKKHITRGSLRFR